jgi:hypothetical protein
MLVSGFQSLMYKEIGMGTYHAPEPNAYKIIQVSGFLFKELNMKAFIYKIQPQLFIVHNCV